MLTAGGNASTASKTTEKRYRHEAPEHGKHSPQVEETKAKLNSRWLRDLGRTETFRPNILHRQSSPACVRSSSIFIIL